MADNPEDDLRRARAERRFNKTLPPLGYWSPLRLVVVILVVAAFVVAAVRFWFGS